MDSAESTSPVDSGDRPHTDSMVTVPLSDAQSNVDPSQPGCSSPSTPKTPTVVFREADDQQDMSQADESTSGSELDDQDRTTDSSSLPDTNGTQQDDAHGDVVDWAELDKTEEQEPRGEQSDEVFGCTLEYVMILTRPVNCPSASSPRAREQRSSQKSQVRLVQCLTFARPEGLPLPVSSYDQTANQ